MGRTAEIARVLSKHGLDWLAHSQSPLRLLALPRRWFENKEQRALTQPERARRALEELGPTYIKLGQAVSTRTDLVPIAYVQELSKLQDHAPPFSYQEVAEIIESELGEPVQRVFTAFEMEPAAAASIGQVHRALLPDGSRVMVKIQRPGVQERIERDLDVLREVAHLLARSVPEEYDLEGSYKEFAFTIRNELDYRREGRNADQFRREFEDDPVLRVPRVHWKYSTRRVLTMERLEGIKIDDVAALDEVGVDRRFLAEQCARVLMTQIFKNGFFHADPHPGNFFVLPSGEVAMLDFGMIGRLDRPTRESVLRFTIAMAVQDVDQVVEELMGLGIAKRPVERQDFKMELRRIMQLHLEKPTREFSFAQLYHDVLATAARHHIRLQSDLLFLARTLAMCEGLAERLDPDFSLVNYAREQLERIYAEQRSPVALLERAEQESYELIELAVDLPKRTRRLIGQIERGEIQISARLSDSKELIENVHRATNRLSMSVLIAGIIAGLSVLTLTLRPDERAGFSAILIRVMLLAVLVGGAGLLISLWRAGKQP